MQYVLLESILLPWPCPVLMPNAWPVLPYAIQQPFWLLFLYSGFDSRLHNSLLLAPACHHVIA